MLATLAALTEEDDSLTAVLKLLISCPTKSRAVAQMLDLEDVFTLPETIERTHQGFNAHAFAKRARGQIRGVESRLRPEPDWDSDGEDGEEEEETESE